MIASLCGVCMLGVCTFATQNIEKPAVAISGSYLLLTH